MYELVNKIPPMVNDLPVLCIGLVVLSFFAYNKPMVYLFIFIVFLIL